MQRIKCGYGLESDWQVTPSDSGVGVDISGAVMFELTLNDQKEQAWEEGSRECYRQMELQMQKFWDRVSFLFEDREKVNVGEANWKRGGIL